MSAAPHFACAAPPLYACLGRRNTLGKFLVLTVALTAWLPLAAMARPNPAPPPSGVVVHLFGQDSIMSNVLPTAPNGAAAGGSSNSTPPPAYVEPTTGEILHQMFVTGDPNDPTQPSTGRTRNRLSD
jgi:hypothetical protein